MANVNLSRVAQVQPSMRLIPPAPLPEKFLNRFPELKEWQDKNMEIWKRNEQTLAQQIAVAGTATAG